MPFLSFTFPPRAPAGKPRSRENMPACSAEPAPGFPPREPPLLRPRHAEGHRLPPPPRLPRRASKGRLQRAAARGETEGDVTAGDGVMTSAPSPAVEDRFPLALPFLGPGGGCAARSSALRGQPSRGSRAPGGQRG